MRAATIQKRINEINGMYDAAALIESESERLYGFVTPTAHAKYLKIHERMDRLTETVIATLHNKGLCSVDGVTIEDAANDRFANIESLFTLGDGSWC